MCTITNWELNHTNPEIQYMPRIIDFLGFIPFEMDGTFGQRLKLYRMCKGLSQEKLAEDLGIDESTLWKWEAGISQPSRRLRQRLEEVLV